MGGILAGEDLIEDGFTEANPYPVRLIVPGVAARYFDWFSTPEDEQAYTEYARKVMDEYYPILTEDSYVEQGYTVRIARKDTMVKMLNIAIVLAEIVLYGFVMSLIPGILFGIAIPFVINLSIRKAFPVRYQIPWMTFVAGTVGLSAVVLLLTHVEVSRMKNKSIIDEIRMDVMR